MKGIKEVSCMNQPLPVIDIRTNYIDWEGKEPNDNSSVAPVAIGYDFMKTAGIQILQGRDFSPDFRTDSSGYILNETAVKKIGYKTHVGRSFTLWGKKGTIIGLVKDFHFASLHDRIEPLIFRFSENSSNGKILIRAQSGQTKQAIEKP
jgi:hypothetical protein